MQKKFHFLSFNRHQKSRNHPGILNYLNVILTCNCISSWKVSLIVNFIRPDTDPVSLRNLDPGILSPGSATQLKSVYRILVIPSIIIYPACRYCLVFIFCIQQIEKSMVVVVAGSSEHVVHAQRKNRSFF